MRPAKHWEVVEVCNTGLVANMQPWRIILPELILVASLWPAFSSQPIELSGQHCLIRANFQSQRTQPMELIILIALTVGSVILDSADTPFP